LLAQLHRSLQADSNALRGWAGAKRWLQLQAVPILVRSHGSLIAFACWQLRFPHSGALTAFHMGAALVAGWNADEFLDKALTTVLPAPWPRGLRVDISVLEPKGKDEKPSHPAAI
jgi:hypothetical protein